MFSEPPKRRIVMSPTLLLVLLGCTSDETNGGNAMPYCEEVEMSLEAAEESPLGISPADLIELLENDYTQAVTWEDGTTACLEATLDIDESSVRFVESSEVYPVPENGGPVPAIAVDCPDFLAVDAVVSLTSSDGKLAETLETVLVLDEYSEDLGIRFYNDIEEIEGSLDISSEDEIFGIGISGLITESFSGELSMQTTKAMGEMVLAENHVLASWEGSESCVED
jgi:hypothetical protein